MIFLSLNIQGLAQKAKKDWVKKICMTNKEGEVVIMGDFNEVRNKSERFGTLFNRPGTDVFNRFISNAGLKEEKIKWAIEGDENSKYYHGVINKKRNQLSIHGILVEGTWIDSPSLVKSRSKILANRLVVVLGGLVNEIQSAFVADKQILDGPFILNELVQWCKKKKKQLLVFKVDFEKAFD
nr:RNA-directed DNA polymerase, eukaryota [Tanacetum cinerariifolium]